MNHGRPTFFPFCHGAPHNSSSLRSWRFDGGITWEREPWHHSSMSAIGAMLFFSIPFYHTEEVTGVKESHQAASMPERECMSILA
jgi:hypothetical protein